MPTYTAITGRRGVPGGFTPKQIRCSLSSLELTCPGTPDLPQKWTANAPAAPRLRVTAKKKGRVLRATVRGASDSRALVAVQARGVELLRRVLLLKASSVVVSFHAPGKGRYQFRAATVVVSPFATASSRALVVHR